MFYQLLVINEVDEIDEVDEFVFVTFYILPCHIQ